MAAFSKPHAFAIFLTMAGLLSPATLYAQRPSASLVQGFRLPPPSAGPWVFWMWLRVQTSREAITADLEAMHAEGIRGAILYDSGVGGGMEATSRMELQSKSYVKVPTSDFAGAHFTPIPYPAMRSWQPQSRDLVRWAAHEAGRLGVKLVVTVGLASTSGDIDLEDGQKFLEWSEIQVRGGSQVQAELPIPDHIVSPSRVSVRSMVTEHLKPGVHPGQTHTVAVLAVPDREGFRPEEVVDVTHATDSSGHLTWKAPEGRWRILRFTYEPTGMTNAWGLYTDAMSTAALEHTWNATMGKLLGEMTPMERKGVYGVEDDSWEAGISTWTEGYEREFQRRRGYNLLRWLPALAQLPMGTDLEREGVKRDFYRTTADLIAERHYRSLGELARRNRLVFFSEASGPNSGQLDPQQNFAGVDVPMGEFWQPSEHRPTPDRRFLIRDAASAANVYGKPVLGCESFTSVGPHWEDTFFDMKNTADQGFADGCNLIAIHNFSQSPSLTAKPGYVYFAGTHYNRNVTWWKQTPAFNTYLARISYLLQQGVFVADALYFRGNGIGQIEQRKSVPALPAVGYDHTNISLDGLLHRVTVRGGRLVLPNGAGYAMLVLPAGAEMSPEALDKIASLVQDGATVVGPRPSGPSGFQAQDTAARRHFEETVTALWDTRRARHVQDRSVTDTLASLQLPSDVAFTGLSETGDLDWLHRRVGQTDIYFVASRWDAPEKIVATFRVQGKQPELWNPVTGEIRSAKSFSQKDGTTSVPLELDPRGSVFVVFRKTIPKTSNGSATSNYPTVTPLQTLDRPWHVAFDLKWGGPADITFTQLTDWTQRPEANIRHYSGTAVYATDFHLAQGNAAKQRLLLDLGTVHEVASVRLNGKDLGIVWTRPARVALGRTVRSGENHLEITVVNLWPNRLIADEALPADQRLTQTNAHKFDSRTPLYPSGLIGPVQLELETAP